MDTAAANLFVTPNDLVIADSATPTVDVGIRVAYGVLSSADAVHTGVQVIQAPPANGTQTGVDDGTDWVAGWMYIRGNVDHVNDYLATLQYNRLDDHGSKYGQTLGDAVVDDYVTVTVDDRGTNANSPWWGNPVNRSTSVTIPILYQTA